MSQNSDSTTSHRRTAIVTGAARGIGAAIAGRLAADGFGVAILDLDKEAAETSAASIRAAGGQARGYAANVADGDSVERAVNEVALAQGAPTVLVNNAGVLRDNLLFRMSDSDWDTVIDVHLRGTFLMTRTVQKHMVEAGWGRIVNLSSSSALGNRGQANYSAAKAGIQGITKTMAIELGQFGVTCNAIAPGFIRTDMTAATAKRLHMNFDDFIRQSAVQIPVRRVGTPEDVAAAASYFCSEDASFVSGQVLYVAGGPLA